MAMVADIIDGKAIAEAVRAEVAQEVLELQRCTGVTPGLAVILVGSRPDSATYVRMKKKACEEVGIASFGFDYPADVAEDVLLSKIMELNQAPEVHGILVQLPLPEHIHESRVLDAVVPEKDVDGLHPINVAKLAHTKTHYVGPREINLRHVEFHVACTPQGCIELLERSGVSIEGKEAVVLGCSNSDTNTLCRSNIVGVPVALLLMQCNATVTVVHSRTVNPAEVVRRADIVIAAVGRANMVRGDWLKPGAVVIDVGMNSVDDPTSKKGYKLVGDCDFDSCASVCSKITPVPGGVGPMTIAMLLRNTMYGARRMAQTMGNVA